MRTSVGVRACCVCIGAGSSVCTCVCTHVCAVRGCMFVLAHLCMCARRACRGRFVYADLCMYTRVFAHTG